MIVIISARDYLKQYILHHCQEKGQQKDFIETNSSNSLSFFLLSHFRQPKGDEIMPELHDGLKIRISSKLKLEKKIYLSTNSQKAFLELAHKMFKDEFRNYMKPLLYNGAFVVGAIKDFLETRGVEYDTKTYEMLSKDFYRWRRKLNS